MAKFRSDDGSTDVVCSSWVIEINALAPSRTSMPLDPPTSCRAGHHDFNFYFCEHFITALGESDPYQPSTTPEALILGPPWRKDVRQYGLIKPYDHRQKKREGRRYASIRV
ncbi:hypothetical protein RND71_008282 [Anisodus tanguticus]|uniref:Uncharacterized protein n=1 Tax=Anisodus tanguticus TaxID=243964 RepID=A0AAE1SKI7_9SOLA|nr:hypothetical protein RND71_008282 [Anisodus tanguticus]